MAYCTAADIYKILPVAQVIRLTDDDATGAVDTDRLAEAIDAAAEEIDAWIGQRCKLPLTTSAPILGKLNADMAVYNLYGRYSEQIPETRADRYKAAVRVLEKIAEGKISLGVQPEPDPPDAGDGHAAIQTSSREQQFTTTLMGKY